MKFTVAIVGRPNVGKSTLFNRLVGKRSALVDDRPGVTRDRREGRARLGDLTFTVIDTAGLEQASPQSLTGRMQEQTAAAVAAADAVLFLIDIRAGTTPADRDFADLVRRSGKPAIVIANKSEGKAAQAGMLEAYELGLGEPVAISAEHGEGLADLYEALRAALPEATAAAAGVERRAAASDGDAGGGDAAGKPIRIAVVGRPNSGKSTLVNRLVGEERVLTGPEAGITRDAIAVDVYWRDRQFRVHDTAGLRRRSRIEEKLEKLSVADALNAVRFAEVVILLLDAEKPFEEQDLRIADLIEREGRALVIGMNKWDLVESRPGAIKQVAGGNRSLAATGQGCAGRAGLGADRRGGRPADAGRGRRACGVEPAGGNECAQSLARRSVGGSSAAGGVRPAHPARLHDAAEEPAAELRVVHQPPEAVPDAYRRYLVNSLRESFDLPGTPIRLTLREKKNPYAKKGKR